MPTRSEERTQFLSDIIITAVEGGTNYWAYAAGYEWSDDDPSTTQVYLADMEEVLEYEQEHGMVPDPKKGEPWNHVTIETVARAFGILEKAHMGIDERYKEEALLNAETGKRMFLHPDLRKRYLEANRENDAGEFDAGDADNIVQIGMFGTVVYG